MRQKLTFLIFFTVAVIFSAYLLLPSPGFPQVPPGGRQSTEPADTESTYRRSYYTNLSRAEVIAFYKDQFRYSPFMQTPIFQLRINHPPEEAEPTIRDQTRSSWMEELVHPWRESFFINGFYPTKPTEQINIAGTHYLNKITVRLVPSHPVTRMTILGMTIIISAILFKEYVKA
jgi:hypothetical protein